MSNLRPVGYELWPLKPNVCPGFLLVSSSGNFPPLGSVIIMVSRGVLQKGHPDFLHHLCTGPCPAKLLHPTFRSPWALNMAGQFSTEAVCLNQHSSGMFEHVPEAAINNKRVFLLSKTRTSNGVFVGQYVNQHAMSAIIGRLWEFSGLYTQSVCMAASQHPWLKFVAEFLGGSLQPFFDACRVVIELSQKEFNLHDFAHGIICYSVKTRNGRLHSCVVVVSDSPDK